MHELDEDAEPVRAATPPRPAGRYGDRRASGAGPRRRTAVAVAALLAAGVGYAAWFGWSSRDDVSWRSQGYDVVDDTLVDVTFTAIRPPGTVLTCQVEALSSASAQVGLVSVEVPAAEEQASTVTAQVRTQSRAVLGQPRSCEVSGG